MKSLWNKIIAWFKPKTRNDESYELGVHRHTHLDLIELPQERLNELAKEVTEDAEKEKDIFDQKPEIEYLTDGRIQLTDRALEQIALHIAIHQGTTIEQASNGIEDAFRMQNYYDIAEDGPEEITSIKRNKIQDFIDQKKNRKPFYKDDNKKDWE